MSPDAHVAIPAIIPVNGNDTCRGSVSEMLASASLEKASGPPSAPDFRLELSLLQNALDCGKCLTVATYIHPTPERMGAERTSAGIAELHNHDERTCL